MFLKTLQFRLIALIIAVAIVSSGAMEILAQRLSTSTVEATVESLLESVTTDVADNIEDEVEKQFHLLEGVAAIDFVQDESIPYYEKSPRVLSVASISSDYENIGFYDDQARSVTADGREIQLPDREYFKVAITGRRYLSDPYYSQVANRVFQTFSVPVKTKSGKIIGIISTNIYGETLSNKIADMKIGNESKITVINRKDGTIAASTDSSEVLNGGNAKTNAKSEMQDIMNSLFAGKTGDATFRDPATKKIMIAAYRPVPNTDWSVLCTTTRDSFFHSLDLMRMYMHITLLVILVASVIISYILARITVNPLNILARATRHLSSGEADLSRRIDSNSEGEIGNVVSGFNEFLEKLHSIMKQIKSSKDTLGTVGQDLEASTIDTSAAITEILANIESVHSQVNHQSASVHQTASAVNEIASNIESLEKMIEHTTNGVSEASAAVEQMIGNIRSVNVSVEKMSDSFEELSTSAQQGTQIQAGVNARVEEIKEMSETLQEANKAISSIASQTNLLAMNAAIEAAHAGEAGAGFAVVSDEIRKLSETSAAQTKTIGEQLKNIRTAIASVVTASEQSSSAFHTVSDKINETDEIVRQIKAAMQEQTEGSKQISTVLHSMNDSALEVRSAGKEMLDSNKAILGEMHNLQDATDMIQSSMEEMNTGARKITETGEALKGIAFNVKSSIDEIGAEVDTFKV